MTAGDLLSDSDPEDIFQQKAARNTVPIEMKKEEVEDPHRILKVELSSLLNTNVRPMSINHICQAYSDLFCEELHTKAKKFGLSVSELFDVISDTVAMVKGPDGEILYVATCTEKSKDIRAQIVQQSRGPRREVKKKGSGYGAAATIPQDLVSRAMVPNQEPDVKRQENIAKKQGSTPLSTLVGGPKSDSRCSLIVKMIRDNGVHHTRSGRMRIRISKLQRIYADMLNNLPLWGCLQSERQCADSMGSEEYAKYWQVSSEESCNPTTEDEFVYFIDVAPEGEESSRLLPESERIFLPKRLQTGRPTLSRFAYNMIRRSLPAASTSQLPCDRLPESREDLNSRQRVSTTWGPTYSKHELCSLSHNCDVNETVIDVLTKFPKLRPRVRVGRPSTISSPGDPVSGQARLVVGSSSKKVPSMSSSRSLNVPSLSTKSSHNGGSLIADIEWLRGAPCVVDTENCNYISGTPLAFLPPSSALFVLRYGNEESERVCAVNDMLQNYYVENQWTVLDCQPGSPCVARSLFEGEYSYVRAVVVESIGANSFAAICMDMAASITIDAREIGPLPSSFSVMKLVPSLFVGRIRNVHVMGGTFTLISDYNNAGGEVARTLPAAVFGRIGNDIILDWVDPRFCDWVSNILIDNGKAQRKDDGLPDALPKDAWTWMKEMEAGDAFKFAGLEFIKDDDSHIEDNLVKESAAGDVNSIGDSPYVTPDTDVGVSSERRDVNEHFLDATSRRNITDSAHFLEVFLKLCRMDSTESNPLFIASSLAFAASAKVAQPEENWDDVIAAIRNML